MTTKRDVRQFGSHSIISERAASERGLGFFRGVLFALGLYGWLAVLIVSWLYA